MWRRVFLSTKGQVEVPQSAVVTDYSEASALQLGTIEKRNARILQLGSEKVGTLETIKSFRKKINLLDWSQKMSDFQQRDIEEMTIDVHMLRVTKNMQSLLKGRVFLRI